MVFILSKTFFDKHTQSCLSSIKWSPAAGECFDPFSPAVCKIGCCLFIVCIVWSVSKATDFLAKAHGKIWLKMFLVLWFSARRRGWHGQKHLATVNGAQHEDSYYKHSIWIIVPPSSIYILDAEIIFRDYISCPVSVLSLLSTQMNAGGWPRRRVISALCWLKPWRPYKIGLSFTSNIKTQELIYLKYCMVCPFIYLYHQASQFFTKNAHKQDSDWAVVDVLKCQLSNELFESSTNRQSAPK